MDKISQREGRDLVIKLASGYRDLGEFLAHLHWGDLTPQAQELVFNLILPRLKFWNLEEAYEELDPRYKSDFVRGGSYFWDKLFDNFPGRDRKKLLLHMAMIKGVDPFISAPQKSAFWELAKGDEMLAEHLK